MALASASPAISQVKVFVSGTAEDIVGRQLVTRIKERIALSPLFDLTYDRNQPAMNVSIVTINPDETRRLNNQTVYSLIISIQLKDTPDILVNNWVGYCGSEKVDSCAQTVLSNLDASVDEVRELMASISSK